MRQTANTRSQFGLTTADEVGAGTALQCERAYYT
jgi:hypothetical protein